MIAIIFQLIQQLSSIITNTQVEFWTIGASAVILILSVVRLYQMKAPTSEDEKEFAYNH